MGNGITLMLAPKSAKALLTVCYAFCGLAFKGLPEAKLWFSPKRFKVTEGGQNLRMKVCFNPSQVLTAPVGVLSNHHFAVPIKVLECILAFVPIKERVNVMDRKRSRVLPSLKLPFGIVKRGEYFSIATPSHDKKIDCVNQLEIKDINCTGSHYTWVQSMQNPSNGILKKINMVMSNVDFIGKYSNTHVGFLPYLSSYHSPIVLVISKVMPQKHRAFMFSKFIADKPEFIKVMEKKWKFNNDGCKMFKLVKKQKAMNYHLEKLAWKNGNLYERVIQLKEKLQSIWEALVGKARDLGSIQKETRQKRNFSSWRLPS
ncbi:hypothetical protein Tco_1361551 [Tanacetum coccineum]